MPEPEEQLTAIQQLALGLQNMSPENIARIREVSTGLGAGTTQGRFFGLPAAGIGGLIGALVMLGLGESNRLKQRVQNDTRPDDERRAAAGDLVSQLTRGGGL